MGNYLSNNEKTHKQCLYMRKRFFTLLTKNEGVPGKEDVVKDLQNKLIDNFREDKLFDYSTCPIYLNSNIKVNKICFACRQNDCPVNIKMEELINRFEGTRIPENDNIIENIKTHEPTPTNNTNIIDAKKIFDDSKNDKKNHRKRKITFL